MQKVTVENFTNFPEGTKVEFNFGAYFPTMKGEITGFAINPATKYFPADVMLLAEYYDPFVEDTISTTVTQFTEKGIGVRVIEMPKKQPNKESPWKK